MDRYILGNKRTIRVTTITDFGAPKLKVEYVTGPDKGTVKLLNPSEFRTRYPSARRR
jgi:hypothetical protein